ncbi:unnamed protein product [Paramecium sonneborni]|uniref:RING-type domain-containing protein n=1 Tax=Paramecium sonneborni TaxID=65129 RepID=A0A8S1MIV4_9CILI|nr:unnamed protein product [Paramecium sonneborni]
MIPTCSNDYDYNNFKSNNGYPQILINHISPLKNILAPSRQEILIDILQSKFNGFIKEVEIAKQKIIKVIKDCSENNIFTILDKPMNFDDYINFIENNTKNYLNEIKNHHKLTINLITQESSEITHQSSSFDMQQMCDKCQLMVEKDLVSLNCFHCYHQKCVGDYIKIQINNNCKTLRCLNCQQKINTSILRKFVPFQLIDKMFKEQLKSIKNSFLQNQIFSCKKPGCNYFCIRHHGIKGLIRCQICESIINN